MMTQILEPNACATCPYYAPRNDGTDKGWCKLFNIFARETHAQTQDCVNTIGDEQVVAQQELNEYVEIQADAIAPEQELIVATAAPHSIEIDSDFDPDFGIMYRVWYSYHLLGTFYRADSDGLWVTQPVGSNFRPRLDTPEQAQLVIIASYLTPNLVAA